MPKMLLVVGVFCLLLLGGFFWSFHESPKSDPVSPVMKKSFLKESALGDTNTEVLRTVVANQRSLQKQNEKLQEENKKLKQSGIEKFQDKLLEIKSTLQEQIAAQKKAIAELQTHIPYDTPHKNEKGEITTEAFNSMDATTKEPEVIHEIPDLSVSRDTLDDPLSRVVETNHKKNLPPILPSDERLKEKKEVLPPQKIPYYTIPANSTLNHVVLMTSLIAEVPVGGRLIAPAFPFKAIIGRKDLFAANGHSVPREIAGIVMEGYSIGNMTMSCARPYVTRVLFVFEDGHFVVYPDKSEIDATQIYPKETLGFLSDAYGNTCINGEYLTDAPKVIANMAVLGGTAATASALSSSQMTTLNNGSQSNTQLTGNAAKYMGGAFLNGASQKALDWYTTRVADVFDAVFIPATSRNKITQHIEMKQMVFHVEQTIPVDLDKKGRTLRYEAFHFQAAYARHFD
ncbi:MAG: uncharacterized protein K0R24_387 [Gammaproteobacteria bacterium]|nr:uncharacterized protein [Gammaproteobacteria bacterium]